MRLVPPDPHPRSPLPFSPAAIPIESAQPRVIRQPNERVPGAPERLGARGVAAQHRRLPARAYAPPAVQLGAGRVAEPDPARSAVCGLQEGRQAAMRVDSFSTAPVDCQNLNELFQQDVSLVPHLIKLWEENRCQAVLVRDRARPVRQRRARARARHGSNAPTVLAHGTHDASGNMTSFFVFAGRPGTLGRQADLPRRPDRSRTCTPRGCAAR